MKTEFSPQVFETYTNIISYENPDRRTDTTKLMVDFRNFANAPKNNWQFYAENPVEVSEMLIESRILVPRRVQYILRSRGNAYYGMEPGRQYYIPLTNTFLLDKLTALPALKL